MTTQCPRIAPLGDSAVTIDLGDSIDEQTNARTHAFARRLAAAAERDRCITDIVPTYRSVTIHVAAGCGPWDQLMRWIGEVARAPESWSNGPRAAGRVVRVPVTYGGRFGPDLSELARTKGLSEEAVIQHHTASPYHCYMLGFAPGFPFLGTVPEPIQMPRLATPRPRVHAGAVGIAGPQTGVYPSSTPGGWRWIGTARAHVFDPHRADPFLIHPGDQVQFVAVDDVEPPSSAWTEQEGPLASRSDALPVSDGAPRVEADAAGLFHRRDRAQGSLAYARVVRSGLRSTIQDAGRFGYAAFGVSAAGAMDQIAMRIANWLVGNEGSEACIEAVLAGPTLIFPQPVRIAVCGAHVACSVNRQPVPMWTELNLPSGSRLEVSAATDGCYAYIAVAGGWRTPVLLGSRSMDSRLNADGLAGRPMANGDALGYLCNERDPDTGFTRGLRVNPAGIDPYADEELPIRVAAAPQTDQFPHEARDAFVQTVWTIGSGSSRMAVRLDGPDLPVTESTDIVSDAVCSGSIQVLPTGEPLILGADAQTVGGYAKIGVVVEVDKARLAQMRPGRQVRFQWITLNDALVLAREQRHQLETLRIGLRLMREKRNIDR